MSVSGRPGDSQARARLFPGEDREVKGKSFKKGDQVPSFAFLQDDGSTCSGNWLYCNSYTGPEKKHNKMARRGKKDAINRIGLYPEWAWCWPVNRRIIYNRASVDLEGRPWSSDRWVIRWNAGENKWEGYPELEVSEQKKEQIYASLLLMRCAGCHGQDQIGRFANLTVSERHIASQAKTVHAQAGICRQDMEEAIRVYTNVKNY